MRPRKVSIICVSGRGKQPHHSGEIPIPDARYHRLHGWRQKRLIKSEIDHLNWLSIEQALHQDEFLNVNGLPEQVMRDAYKRIYDSYQPGPVMDFKHYPEHFEYYHGNHNDGQTHCTDYAGQGWREGWSSATAPLVPGSERFTLQKVGVDGAHEKGRR